MDRGTEEPDRGIEVGGRGSVIVGGIEDRDRGMRCRVLEGQRDSSVITLVTTSVIYKRFSSSVGCFKRSVIYSRP